MPRHADMVVFETAARLLSNRAYTPRQLAELLGITKVATYNLLHRLEAAGYRLVVESAEVREGLRGPVSKAYRILR